MGLRPDRAVGRRHDVLYPGPSCGQRAPSNARHRGRAEEHDATCDAGGVGMASHRVTILARWLSSCGTLSSRQAPSLLPLCRASRWCSGMLVRRPAGLGAQPMRPPADPTSLHQAPVPLLGRAPAESGRSPPVEVRRIDSIGSLDRGSDRCAGSPGPPTRQAVPPRVMRRGRGLEHDIGRQG